MAYWLLSDLFAIGLLWVSVVRMVLVCGLCLSVLVWRKLAWVWVFPGVWAVNGLLFCGGCFDLVAFGLVMMLHFMNWFVAFRFPLVLF